MSSEGRVLPCRMCGRPTEESTCDTCFYDESRVCSPLLTLREHAEAKAAPARTSSP